MKIETNLKTTPYKLNIGAMTARCAALKHPISKMNFLMNLLTLKKNGILYASDFIQILKTCHIDYSGWNGYVATIMSENSLFTFAELVSFAASCEVLEMTEELKQDITCQLEYIYRNE